MKSTVSEIKERFDQDVDRFSNLDTGQISTLDANYLEESGGVAYRNHALKYIEKEDSPRSLNYQLGLLKRVGFQHVEILHKNLCFAAFGALKP